MLFLLLLPALQDSEALLRHLGDADLEVRERTTRRLLDGFRTHQAAIEKRLQDGTDPETAARLRDLLRRGPAWADRRELEAALGAEFAAKNGAHLKGLFGDEKDAFLRATDRLFRENPNQERELVECYLYAFRKAVERGWIRDDPYVDYPLYVQTREAHRPRIAAAVRPLIDHADETGAWKSLRILSAVEGRAARPALLAAFASPRPGLRGVAAGLLADTAEAADAPWLQSLLTDPDPARRGAGLRGLVKLGAADRSEAIAGLLDDPQYFLRRQAIDALGRLKAHAQAVRIVPFLADTVGNGADARDWAYRALLVLNSEAAENETLRHLDHREPAVRISALRLLGHWKAVRHAVACAARLEDPQAGVRAAAVDALAAMNARTELEGISKRLDDPAAEVRSRAAVALGLLRRPQDAARVLERVAAGTIDTPSAVEALIRMDAREHGEKVGEMLVTLAEKLPDIRGLMCGTDERLDVHRRLDALLKLAVEWKCDAVLVPLARGALRIKDPGRQRLLGVLARASSPAAAELLTAAPPPATPEARRALAGALAASPTGKSVAAVMELVRGANDEDMFHLSHDLRGLSAAPALLEPYLRDPAPRIRALVVDLLCLARNPKQAGLIVAALADPSPEVRAKAAYGLSGMPLREPHGALARLVGDADPFVQSVAMQVVGELGLKEAVPLLLERLKGDSWGNALKTLERLEARDAWKEVAALLSEREKAPEAARLLGAWRAEGAREALARAAREKAPELRAEAVRALAALGAKEELPFLDELFDAPEPALRAAAVDAAGLLKAFQPRVLSRLEDPSPRVVASALKALAAMGGRPEDIAPRLASKEVAVAAAAAEALVVLGAREHARPLKDRILEGKDPFEIHTLTRSLLRLDPKGHMDFLLERSAQGWGSTLLYELNRARAPELYARIGRARISDVRLLEPGTHRALAARLREAHGIELVFDETLPDTPASVYGFGWDPHRWLEVMAIPQNAAPLFDEKTGRIRVVPLDVARRAWRDWTAEGR